MLQTNVQVFHRWPVFLVSASNVRATKEEYAQNISIIPTHKPGIAVPAKLQKRAENLKQSKSAVELAERMTAAEKKRTEMLDARRTKAAESSARVQVVQKNKEAFSENFELLGSKTTPTIIPKRLESRIKSLQKGRRTSAEIKVKADEASKRRG